MKALAFLTLIFFYGSAVVPAEPDDCDGSLHKPLLLPSALQRVQKLFSEGLNNEDLIGGYFGVSLEGLQEALKTGKLPIERLYESVPTPGFYFYGVKGQVPDIPRSRRYMKHDHALLPTHKAAAEAAEPAAINSAFGRRLLALLQIPFSEKVLDELSDLPTGYKKPPWSDNEYMRILDHLNLGHELAILKNYREVTMKELRSALLIARKRKGLVVAISKKAFEKYPITDGPPSFDFFLPTGGQGLPLEDIEGIEPLGQEEWDYLESLK
jgi:hypothetical protein